MYPNSICSKRLNGNVFKGNKTRAVKTKRMCICCTSSRILHNSGCYISNATIKSNGISGRRTCNGSNVNCFNISTL